MDQRLYCQLSDIEDSHWWFLYRRKLVDDFLSKINFAKDIKGLDIGCGTGGNLKFFAKYCQNIIGLDCAELALRLAKKKCPEYTFIRADINYLSNLLKPESFGLITIFNVLYHNWVLDELKVLKQCNNILKKGGILIITEPSFNILKHKHDIQAMCKRRYKLTYFDKLLKEAGFAKISYTYFNAVSFLPVLLTALIDNLCGRMKQNHFNDNIVRELQISHDKINNFLIRLLDIERIIIRAFSKLPFGVSLLCLARKPL